MTEKTKEPIHLIRERLREGRMVSYCGRTILSMKAMTPSESEATCKNCLKSRAHLRKIEDARTKNN